jgi:LysM repeat protein
MALMSGATYRPVPNCTKGGQQEVRGVVVHIMAGTLAGTDSWFRNPKAQASSHFGTGKTGLLYQWVSTADRAWAQSSGNRTWLSVENEGKGGDTLTDAQLDRNAQVLAWAHKVHDVPLQVAKSPSGKGLGYHAMGGADWGGHTACPGPKIVAQLPEIVKRAKALVGGSSIVPKSRETAATMLKQQTVALKTWSFIPTVEKTHGLPANLLIAVGSRETNLTNKVGDGGHGHGVWQRDDRWWTIPDGYDQNVRQQAEDAATLLAANYKALGGWGPAVAAYNAGLTGVKDAIKAGKSPDSVTTGGDYAADVLGRLAHLTTQASSGGTSSSTGTYTVKKGDTLTSIAKAHGTTVAKLVSANGLKDADEIKVGQVLKLSATAAPAYEPFPGAAFFHGGRYSPIVTAMGRRLVALGFGQSYKTGPGPNWTNADKAAVRAFQLSRADLKGDADGIPGPKTWAALKIPKV